MNAEVYRQDEIELDNLLSSQNMLLCISLEGEVHGIGSSSHVRTNCIWTCSVPVCSLRRNRRPDRACVSSGYLAQRPIHVLLRCLQVGKRLHGSNSAEYQEAWKGDVNYIWQTIKWQCLPRTISWELYNWLVTVKINSSFACCDWYFLKRGTWMWMNSPGHARCRCKSVVV